MIVEEIDRRYCESLSDLDDEDKYNLIKNTAILWDGRAKMASLSVICSHSVNGVAKLHTDILKQTVLKDFYTLTPEKFVNVTNGVSPRRFLMQADPALTKLITEAIGEDWKNDNSRLEGLLKFADDPVFAQKLASVKRANKCVFANYVAKHNGIQIDPDSIFDIQVKRIHAYKRQLLNCFKIMDLYNTIKQNPAAEIRPYTFIFAGKAAQSYTFAKDVIKLINSIADLVNNDPDVNGRIKVVFIENFNVSNAQYVYPAADISEQISTAGKEASGTGCMKFMYNGAVTLGTLDGANVEIKEVVGDDNIYIFGLTADEAMDYYVNGGYIAGNELAADPRLRLITDQLKNGFFTKTAGCDFWGIYNNLMYSNDEYFVLKDFDSYMKTWNNIGEDYDNKPLWTHKSVVNIAKAGYFSSDRSIRDYCRDIWKTVCD